MSEKKYLKLKCVLCKKNFNYYDSKFRPFCCYQCKMIDLNNWLDGSYAVPSEENYTIDEETYEGE